MRRHRQAARSVSLVPGVTGRRTTDPELEAKLRVAWETTPESAKQTGARFGVSANSIISLAHRRGWKSFNKGESHKKSSYRTMDERLAEVWSRMTQALEETKAKPSHREIAKPKSPLWVMPE